jgi:hypothetical protein
LPIGILDITSISIFAFVAVVGENSMENKAGENNTGNLVGENNTGNVAVRI